MDELQHIARAERAAELDAQRGYDGPGETCRHDSFELAEAAGHGLTWRAHYLARRDALKEAGDA